MNRYHHRRVFVAGAAVLAGVVVSASAGASPERAQHASATLRNAAGDVIGFASFTEDATGTLHVNVKVDGLAPGNHGIHIHTVGQCSPTFAAAGGHHNPLGAPTGPMPAICPTSSSTSRVAARSTRKPITPRCRPAPSRCSTPTAAPSSSTPTRTILLLTLPATAARESPAASSPPGKNPGNVGMAMGDHARLDRSGLLHRRRAVR